VSSNPSDAVVPVASETDLELPEPKSRAREILLTRGRGLEIRTLADAVSMSAACFNSRMLPEHIKTQQQALTVLLRGLELGLPPFAAWRWIFPTKQGKLAIESKGSLAVVQASAVYGWYKEWIENEQDPPETWVAVATTLRRGQTEPTMKKFSFVDAQTAKLTGQKKNRDGQVYDTPWVLYLKDLLLAKARERCLSVAYSDVLGGIPTREEAEEIERLESERTAPSSGFALPAPPPRDPLLEELTHAQKAPVALPAPRPDVVADQSAREVVEVPAHAPGPPTLTEEELRAAAVEASVDEALAKQSGNQPTLFSGTSPEPDTPFRRALKDAKPKGR
jgi:hypothetical protein